MTSIKDGKVLRFNPATGLGTVRVGESKFSFGATSFDSGRPARLPVNGEAVDVVFVGSRPDPLSIRAKR